MRVLAKSSILLPKIFQTKTSSVKQKHISTLSDQQRKNNLSEESKSVFQSLPQPDERETSRRSFPQLHHAALAN